MNTWLTFAGLVSTALAALSGSNPAVETIEWTSLPDHSLLPIVKTLVDCPEMDPVLAVGQALVENPDPEHPLADVPALGRINCENLHQITQWQADGVVDASADPSELAIAAYMGGARSVRAAQGLPQLCDTAICQPEYVELVRSSGERYLK